MAKPKKEKVGQLVDDESGSGRKLLGFMIHCVNSTVEWSCSGEDSFGQLRAEIQEFLELKQKELK